MNRKQLKRHGLEVHRSSSLSTRLSVVVLAAIALLLLGCGATKETTVDSPESVGVQATVNTTAPDGAEPAESSSTSSTAPSPGSTAGANTLSDLHFGDEAPSPRFAQSAVYDPVSGKVIVFAGIDLKSGPPLSDTWAFDLSANAWAKVEPVGISPRGSYGPNMVYDPNRGQAILLTSGVGIETYAYDPVTNKWLPLAGAGDPPDSRRWYSVVYEPTIKKVLLFAGRLEDNPAKSGDLLAFDTATSTWTALHPRGETPPARDSQSMVYDPTRGEVILFGGSEVGEGEPLGDTWSYDAAANRWARLHPRGESPSPRTGHCMVYDTAGSRIILFGGADDSSSELRNDTWAYDPSANAWTELHPEGASPSPRTGHCMVYDPDAGTVLLFGGMNTEDGILGDVWEYDPVANTWTMVAGSPATTATRPTTTTAHVTAELAALSKALTEGKWVKDLSQYVDGFYFPDKWVYAFSKDGTYSSYVIADSTPTIITGRWSLVERAGGTIELRLSDQKGQKDYYWLSQTSEIKYDKDKDLLVVSGGNYLGEQTLRRSTEGE